MTQEKPNRHPDPAEIRKARLDAGLTLKEAAALIHMGWRGWAQYETDPNNPSYRKIHPGLWELFNLKVKKLKKKTVTPSAADPK